jgi:hypothetical protein
VRRCGARLRRLFLAGLHQYYRLNMVGWILKKILGSKNQREIERLTPMVRQINELDEQLKALSDDEPARTACE